ncbi:MAG: hypothetical protein SXG53_18605 [Pseudomonadota bacterium]|nr:hypothetical protein [Pseudomonadota bacterium]
MKTWAVRSAAALAFVLLVFLSRKNWMYLQAGYHMRVGLEGGPYTAVDGVFPLWRKLLGAAAFTVLAAGVLLGMLARSSAVLAVGLGMAGTLVLGAYDMWWYGTIRSPTSVWNVLFAVALFAATVSAKRVGVLQ